MKNILHQNSRIGNGHGRVARHGYVAPNTNATLPDFGHQPIRCTGVAFVFSGYSRKSGSDRFCVDLMTHFTIALGD